MNRSRWVLKAGKLKPHILEECVVEEVMTRLWWHYKIKVWRVRERIPGVGALSMPGIPDLIGWLRTGRGLISIAARPLFIEVKRPGGAKRAAQIRFIEDAKADGCVAFFAESWDDVVREMEEQGGIKLKEAC